MGIRDNPPQAFICDEVFCIQDDEKNIHIGQLSIPPCSTISGNVDLTVIECRPIISSSSNTIKAALVLFIQKDLVVTTPEKEQYPLEFGFRFSHEVTFEKCSLPALSCTNPRDLRCHVVSIAGEDKVTLNPSHPVFATNATFDEMLTIKIRIRLFQDMRTVAPMGPPIHRLRLKT